MNTKMEDDDKAVLEQVKKSFPCWQTMQMKNKIMAHTNWKSVTGQFIFKFLFLLVVVVVVGISIRQAKDISIWWQNNHNHTHVPCSVPAVTLTAPKWP